MGINAKYLFISSMDVPADKEALFNEVYDNEHVPNLAEVPGVLSVARLKKQTFELSIGGSIQAIDTEAEPRYTAIYEIENPGVLTSDAWAAAIEKGRWPTHVRPAAVNAHRVLYELMYARDLT
jgi:hypothetical protein